jgi:hypothetical protein
MSTWFVILVLASIGTILLSYRRAAAVEAKMQRVLREFQKLGQDLDDLQNNTQSAVGELRKEIYDKLTYKK